jgi:hypothetical protein
LGKRIHNIYIFNFYAARKTFHRNKALRSWHKSQIMLIVPTKKKILPSSTCRRLPSSSFSTSTSKSNSNSNTDTSKQNVSSLETLNTRVTSIQKNLGSTKRQIKALSIYPDRAIRQDASLRLKVAQLELTLKHVFDQSTGSVKKEELDECIAALSVLKQAI